MFTLPPLPYPESALEPLMSRETLATHYGKHHAAYVEKTNKLMKDAKIAGASLEDVVRQARAANEKKLFNNAAQAWNHAFFWNCLSPQPAAQPGAALSDAIDDAFGSVAKFRTKALDEGENHFGSGWLWLVSDARGKLSLKSLHDADTPIAEEGAIPILTCDLWEHAYYLDHKNARRAFLEVFFDQLRDWRFADAQYDSVRGKSAPWRYPPPQSKAA